MEPITIHHINSDIPIVKLNIGDLNTGQLVKTFIKNSTPRILYVYNNTDSVPKREVLARAIKMFFDGYVILLVLKLFPSRLPFSIKSLSLLFSYRDIIPETCVSFLFTDFSWFSNYKKVKKVINHPTWNLSLPIIENEIIGSGRWGVFPSTRRKGWEKCYPLKFLKKYLSSYKDFISILFFGSLGDGLGSYNEDFLKEFIGCVYRISKDCPRIYYLFLNDKATMSEPICINGAIFPLKINMDQRRPCEKDYSVIKPIIDIQNKEYAYYATIDGYVDIIFQP